ncbi:recombinase family protein [Sphingomonas sp. RB1R13]|uniref:recombinase family protein n=1 Tax=Sphingomonas sp. RB1R13 TaxID=3096159 RepID=UPI002FC94DE3
MIIKRRCAIYTRKSTEEGLEQAFNSLDAQREACAAYIMSQTHEGWELINELYDDGGWSGGNMARPGLKQLLTDVEADKVDVIVVYKVDRLTRSLADFARIVDTLDRAGASFVSVTQAFNTTSSMGRLTLNVLLSFAQFEREVTSERIRDKVAASKRKGMWMGGPVPIGYRLADRKLVMNAEEARVVRTIFERYLAHRSMCSLADELAACGVRTKIRQFSNGRTVGGIAFTTGPIAALLKNPVYIGKVAHDGKLYEGEHDGLIDEDLWHRVQSALATNRRARRLGSRSRYPSLLTGMIEDPEGRVMSPTFATKGSTRHHYYISKLQPGEDRKSIWRVPAGEIDRAVIQCLVRWMEASEAVKFDDDEGPSSAVPQMVVPDQRALLLHHSARVQVTGDGLLITLGPDEQVTSIALPACFARRGSEVRLLIGNDDSSAERHPDPALLKLVVLARVAQQARLNGTDDPLVSHYSKAHLQQLLRISWLAPDILSAVVEGRQPVTLTGRRLLRTANIPLNWQHQRELLGFA